MVAKKLPSISSVRLIKILKEFGYVVHHQKGSHLVLLKEAVGRTVVPIRKKLSKGTLRAILRQTMITKEELLEKLYRKK